MRSDLEAIVRDSTLTAIALAIALGWSLYQLAHGVGLFVDGLLQHLSGPGGVYYSSGGGGLTWVVDRRIVALDGIFIGLLELGVVLTVAVLVRRRAATA
jgi:hypothetical protein